MRALEGEQVLARIHFGEDDRSPGGRLVHTLPERLRAEGFAGCTVLRSSHGFGLHRRVHTDLQEVSPPHGVVLEVVDTPERAERLLALLDELLPDGLVTLERAKVIRYRASPGPPPAGGFGA